MALAKKSAAVEKAAVRSAKRREKNQALKQMLRGGGEPEIDSSNYTITLIQALNWHNLNSDLKVCREWLNAYLTDTKRKNLIQTFNRLSDFDVRQLGVLARFKMTDQYLKESDAAKLEDRISEIVSQLVPLEVKKEKPKVDKTIAELEKYIPELDGILDDFLTKKRFSFSFAEFIADKAIPTAIAKRIAEHYTKLLTELQEACVEGSIMAEGYSTLTAAKLKKYITYVSEIINTCNATKKVIAERKPRAKKAKPPEKVVSKLSFLKEFAELKLKSINPAKIVGSTEVWAYNTISRQLMVYRAAAEDTLTAKGASIVGYCDKSSIMLKLRKPEEYFSKVALNKKALNSSIREIKTKPSTVKARLGTDVIILGAF